MCEAFVGILADHFAGSGEIALEGAYELGRQAVHDGVGLLDLADAYHQALGRTLERSADMAEVDSRMRQASMILCESLSPYEMVQRRIQVLNVELEQRVTDRTAQLEAANRELESFSYSVSHDLRAPLRSIDGFSQALLEDYEDRLDEDGKDFLRRVRAASRRMVQLIDDLLNLARVARAEVRREPVDMSALARSIAEELRQSEPERQVEFAIADGVVLNGDAPLLRIVLEDLLGNAWKFTSRRARAQIEFGTAQRDEKPVYFVRDDGAGFDPSRAARLFGPFQRLHGSAEFPGTGIGLATVQRIIRRHGGEISAESAVDQGATFYFTL
jgi:light-regulated signal transduction histidine kinase (bacteriophytochrome)